MSVDIATLGLEIRSDGVVVASDRLKKLHDESGKTEEKTKALSIGFQNLNNSSTTLAGGLIKTTGLIVGIGIAAYAAVSKIIQFGKQSVEAFMSAEKASVALNNALMLQGEGAGTAFELTKLANALQKVTMYDDDFIKSSMQLGLTMGIQAKDMKKVTEVAVDLASAYNLDLGMAYRMLAQVQENSLVMLGRYMPELKGLKLETMSTAEKFDLIGSKVKGFGEAMGSTASGQMAQFKNSMDDMKESLGETLIPMLNSALTALKPFIAAFKQYIEVTFLYKDPSALKSQEQALVAIDAYKKKIESLKEEMAKFGGDIQVRLFLTKQIEEYNTKLALASQILMTLPSAMAKAIPSTENQTKAVENQTEAVQNQVYMTWRQIEAIRMLMETMGEYVDESAYWKWATETASKEGRPLPERTTGIAAHGANEEEKKRLEELKRRMQEYRDAIKEAAIALGDLTKQSILDALYYMGEALGQGKSAGESFEESMQKMVGSILRNLPLMLLNIGLQACANDQWGVGLALIAASGLVAIGAGAYNASLGGAGAGTTAANWSFSAQGNMFANGIVNKPTMIGSNIIGEGGAEAVLPLRRSPGGDLGVSASVGGNTQVIVVNNTGQPVTQEERETSDGKQIKIIVGSIVKEGFARGEFDSMLSNYYGLSRRGR